MKARLAELGIPVSRAEDGRGLQAAISPVFNQAIGVRDLGGYDTAKVSAAGNARMAEAFPLLARLRHLRHLKLDGGRFSRLDGAQRLTSLQTLYLNSTQVSAAQLEAFAAERRRLGLPRVDIRR